MNYFRVDKCCRAHDHCPVKVKAFSNSYGATNYHLYTKSHCACDDLFYKVRVNLHPQISFVKKNFNLCSA